MDAATPEAGLRPFHYFQLVPADAGTAAAHKAAMDQSRRQQLAERVLNSANDTAKTIGTLRAFDRTGNITDSLAHLIASAEATLENAKALADDIRTKSGTQIDTRPDGSLVPLPAHVVPATPLHVAQAEFNRVARGGANA